ncbi:BLUF domain-containing protein [Fulvivirga sp. RKSG066]|uniref:BLUF domain-containing protein n=1 Tax=Fulvivirga aurantia TaxID=2529383 RepID=UPI0012BBC960|nr:BLUF domain-containing protein [Fulvivirga aurantia]MTI22822.1 BLUF domain-containing protein [Fulvivirga aurantia]
MDLHHIIYVSKGININQETIDDILQTAQSFNDAHNITGMLLFIEGKFFQILEGDKAVITKLYESIKSDQRHKNVTTVSAHAIRNRTFKGWSMRFNAIDEKEFTELSGISSLGALFSIKPGPKDNVAFVFAQKFANKSFPSTSWWDRPAII